QLTLFGPPDGTAITSFGRFTDARPAPAEAEPVPIQHSAGAQWIVLLAIVAYIWLFASWTMRHHDGLGTQAFDFGLYDQGVWLLSRFKRPFVTLMGRNLFGDHTSFILLPFVPVYWLIPSGKVLLFSQAAALGLGALPTFLLAREKLRHEMLAAGIAVAYLLHPTLGWINLEQFHPDVFEVPLALFAIYFMVKQRWRPYLVCVVALLLVKEDVVLLTFGLGVYVALKHNRRVGLVTIGLSVLYAAIAFWWVLPALNGVGTLNTWRIPFGGPWGLLKTTVTHPGQVISYLTTEDRLWYVWQLFAPLGFLALAAPALLLAGIAALGSNLVSTFLYQYDIHYHYTSLIYPVVVAATIFGIANSALTHSARKLLTGVVLACSLVAAYTWGPTPLGKHEFVPSDPGTPHVQSFRQAARLLPDDAVVSAFYGWVPQIDHREEVYMFPNPWKASYWGTFKQEGQRLPQADRVEYVMVPTQLDAQPKAVLDSIRGEFAVVYEREGVLLLKRR
ncbi:MAG: DUF2079 domain-containing protein, partial [Actinomycetota bacterium]|nr:DUF2079 domain-containing protein [Actinomycetota bacterium]